MIAKNDIDPSNIAELLNVVVESFASHRRQCGVVIDSLQSLLLAPSPSVPSVIEHRPRVLCHVCDRRVDVLNPEDYEEGLVHFSEDVFVGSFGKWVYVFDYDTLDAAFNLKTNTTGGVVMDVAVSACNYWGDYEYRSQPLGREYKIAAPVDVRKYAMCVIKSMDVHRGTLKERLTRFVQDKFSMTIKQQDVEL